MGTAEGLYCAESADNTPPWASFVTHAEIIAQQGHSYYLLSLTDATAAPAAIEHLTTAINGHAIEHARSRAVALPTLAGAYLQVGDYGSAATCGRDAITAITVVSSERCCTRLRDLGTIAARYDRHPAVAEMREEIDTVTAVAP
ncbi:hypothetical protein [Nocardia amamiensis]|uniref:hypothetical protein n=1 Tax=Nocardia amamiensis TaxID=404578 RepID=UPI0008304816|nr:hypothetical protein [Nocardia amamiensis]